MNGNLEHHPWHNHLGYPVDCIHPLSAVDQSAPREYIRWMYIFDFPDTSELSIHQAIHSIRRGVENALRYYPFLAGKLKVLPTSVVDDVELFYDRILFPERINEIFKFKIFQDEVNFYDYLRSLSMPVSHWKPEEFCAAPLNPNYFIWQPAFTLQANFLGSGGLILCFAFHHSVMDEWSVAHFLGRFSWGIRRARGLISPDSIDQYNTGPLEYQLFDLSEYIVPGPVESFLNFPEWSNSGSLANQTLEYEDAPTNYIVFMSHTMATQWTWEIGNYLRQIQVEGYVEIIDCLVSMIWTEILRAGQTDVVPNRDSRMYIDTNVRNRLRPPLPKVYFGNMSAASVALIESNELMATGEDEDLRSDSIRWFACAAMVIRRTIRILDDPYVRRRITLLNSHPEPARMREIADYAIHCRKSGTRMSNVGIGADISFGIPGAGCGPDDDRPRFIRRPWMRDSHGIISAVPRKAGREAN
ncbi:hypothetical protein F4805DRAFT_86122 [Annulohypoxylon moriforme]|nr:hypothetical protein F4805DRAFT_86122 [Annulohypoxylon moriforme]